MTVSHSQSFYNCPKFELQFDEYEVINSSSVFIEKYNKTLTDDSFEIDDDVLMVCTTIANATDEVAKFSSSLSIITIVCLGTSTVCLLLHLIAAYVSSELHNLSGKNLFSLSLALLGSYVSFTAAMFRDRDENAPSADSGCFALSVIAYFFFMSSFFWMLVIAFDVCRTLRVRKKFCTLCQIINPKAI